MSGLLIAVLVVVFSSCKKRDPQELPSAPAKNDVPAGAISETPFLQGTREIPARKEWNRDFFFRNPGIIHFRVSSTAPFGVTIVTDKAHQALFKENSKLDKSDLLLTVDAKPPTYERRLNVPSGRMWFIIENQSDSPVTMSLECYEVK
jgi:hypothetical protein